MGLKMKNVNIMGVHQFLGEWGHKKIIYYIIYIYMKLYIYYINCIYILYILLYLYNLFPKKGVCTICGELGKK